MIYTTPSRAWSYFIPKSSICSHRQKDQNQRENVTLRFLLLACHPPGGLDDYSYLGSTRHPTSQLAPYCSNRALGTGDNWPLFLQARHNYHIGRRARERKRRRRHYRLGLTVDFHSI